MSSVIGELSAFRMNVRGDRELFQRLGDAPKKVIRRAVMPSMRAQAKVIVRRAKARAPRGETGLLRRFIRSKSKALKGDLRGTTRITIRPGTREQMQIDPNDKYYYPAVIEFGSKKRNIRAQFYMRGSVTQADQAAILQRIRIAMKRAIREGK